MINRKSLAQTVNFTAVAWQQVTQFDNFELFCHC